MLRLSQRHLNLLETCPLKFKELYISQDNLVPNPENEEQQTWGSQFHLLMQQRELGLPIDSILTTENELAASLAALIQKVPELSISPDQAMRAAEHYRTLGVNNYLLSVIYDLVITQKDRAQILDWKTYPQPKNKKKLASDWQTRLYLYVLAETSNYTPEQISMTYWFVKLPEKPQSHTFKYNSQQHKQTEEDLKSLLEKLDTLITEKDSNIPQKLNCAPNCPYCLEIKQKESTLGSDLALLAADIAEIPI